MSSKNMERVDDQNTFCIRIGCPKPTKPTLRSWLWSIAVVAAFIAQVIFNILAGEEFGSFGGASNRQIAEEQPTFLTPDGLTFSVWGIIYLFQGLFSLYQVLPCYQNSHEGVSRARFWVVALFISNCLWLPVFSHRLYWLAFMLMLVMDVSLVMIYRSMFINYGAVDRTQGADMLLPSTLLEDREHTMSRVGGSGKLPGRMLHPWPIKVLCFTGFSTNSSWLAVASMVNLLVATGTSGWRQPYTVEVPSMNGNMSTIANTTVYVNGNEDFTIMGVCLVATIACVMAVRNCDVPYALVAIWALGGVNRAQGSKAANGFPEQAMSKPIADWTTAMMVLVAIAAAIGLVKAIAESKLASKETESVSDDNKTSKLHYTDES